MSKTTIAKVVGILGIAAGLTIGTSACAPANSEATSAVSDSAPKTVSVPITPGAQEKTAPAVSSMELTAGQTPEALAKDYQAVTTDWVNANCSPGTAKDFLNQNGVTPEEYSLKIATEEGQKRAIALLGSNYESNPDLKEYAKNMIALNRDVLNLYIRTMLGNTQGNGYVQTYVLDSLTSSSVDGATTKIVFEGHLHNNGTDFPNVVQPGPTDVKESYSLTFVKSGNTELLTQYQ